MRLLETTSARAKKAAELLPSGMMHDKGSDYARAFSDLYRSIQSNAKLAFDVNPDKPADAPIEVRVVVDDPKAPPDGAQSG